MGAAGRVRLRCPGEKSSGPAGRCPRSPSRAARGLPRRSHIRAHRGRGADPAVAGRPRRPSQATAPSPSDGRRRSTFPLAVVTGLTNLKATVTLEELVDTGSRGRAPRAMRRPRRRAGRGDHDASASRRTTSPAQIRSDPDAVALLPPGLVEPATKVLPIAGDGPYGLFGPDLFGDPEVARPAVPGPAADHRRRTRSIPAGSSTTPRRSGR